jgi:hypothetical protein
MAGEAAVTGAGRVADTVALDSVAVMALAEEVEATSLWVQESVGRVDFRVGVLLVGEIAGTSVAAVSVDGITTFAIVGFAILMTTFSISVSLASDIRIITPITTHTRITDYDAYLGADESVDYGTSRSDAVTSVVQFALSKRGYYRGPIDSVIGAGSRRAIRAGKARQRTASTCARARGRALLHSRGRD